MSSPRYRPRDFVLPSDQGSFGKSNNMRWVSVDDTDQEDQLFAAKLQHRASMMIANEVYSSGSTLKEYAAVAGVGYQRLSQVLRGEVVMRLEDMGAAQRVLGLSFSL